MKTTKATKATKRYSVVLVTPLTRRVNGHVPPIAKFATLREAKKCAVAFVAQQDPTQEVTGAVYLDGDTVFEAFTQ